MSDDALPPHGPPRGPCAVADLVRRLEGLAEAASRAGLPVAASLIRAVAAALRENPERPDVPEA